jgi:uncharacterized protein (TIGR00251 family)
MARVTVKVHPRARHTRVTGKIGDAWKLDLAAPPVDGKANEACVKFFAQLAGVPQSQVRIVLGLSNRTKVVEIEGVSQQTLENLVGQASRPVSAPSELDGG